MTSAATEKEALAENDAVAAAAQEADEQAVDMEAVGGAEYNSQLVHRNSLDEAMNKVQFR